MATRLSVEEMDLAPSTKQAALIIQSEYPDAWFTSGRRTIESQARAMAKNAVIFGPTWLSDTYGRKQGRIVKALMSHMSANPHRTQHIKLLGDDFTTILTDDFQPELEAFPHIVGRAFDIRYPRKDGVIDVDEGKQICSIILRLSKEGRIPLQLLLEKEGGLYVIHSQYVESSRTVATVQV